MPPDLVRLEGLELEGEVGVYAHERGVLQRLVIDVSVETDVRPAAASDAITDAVDYDGLAAIARSVTRARHHALIETIAEEIAGRVLRDFPAAVGAVHVRVAKPGAVPDARTVAVEIQRRR